MRININNNESKTQIYTSDAIMTSQFDIYFYFFIFFDKKTPP